MGKLEQERAVRGRLVKGDRFHLTEERLLAVDELCPPEDEATFRVEQQLRLVDSGLEADRLRICRCTPDAEADRRTTGSRALAGSLEREADEELRRIEQFDAPVVVHATLVFVRAKAERGRPVPPALPVDDEQVFDIGSPALLAEAVRLGHQLDPPDMFIGLLAGRYASERYMEV